MTHRIAFGTDTESLEDPEQLVLVECPDEWPDDDLVGHIDQHWTTLEAEGRVQRLVGEADVVRLLRSIIPEAPGLHPSVSRPVTDYIIDSLVYGLRLLDHDDGASA